FLYYENYKYPNLWGAVWFDLECVLDSCIITQLVNLHKQEKIEMKRSALVIAIVLVLPLILAACGGGATGNAEDFIKAMADGDAKKAKEVSCSAFASTIDLLAEGTSEDSKAEDIKCEKDGDTKVKCDFK